MTLSVSSVVGEETEMGNPNLASTEQRGKEPNGSGAVGGKKAKRCKCGFEFVPTLPNQKRCLSCRLQPSRSSPRTSSQSTPNLAQRSPIKAQPPPAAPQPSASASAATVDASSTRKRSQTAASISPSTTGTKKGRPGIDALVEDLASMSKEQLLERTLLIAEHARRWEKQATEKKKEQEECARRCNQLEEEKKKAQDALETTQAS